MTGPDAVALYRHERTRAAARGVPMPEPASRPWKQAAIPQPRCEGDGCGLPMSPMSRASKYDGLVLCYNCRKVRENAARPRKGDTPRERAARTNKERAREHWLRKYPDGGAA